MKRSTPEKDSERPMKQAKLNFGQKMAPKTALAPRNMVKPGASRGNLRAPATSKNAITSEPPPKAQRGFTVIEKTGDIFDAPDGTVIIHACNCLGSWGAGIAAAFKERYPHAYKRYNDHCKRREPDELIDTALLILPQDGKPKHFVGCLFTSRAYGRGRDSAQRILDATAPSMQELVNQMNELGEDISEIRMCQINSGLFSVPWEHSRAVVESIELDEELKIPQEIIVYSLPTK